MRRSIMPVAMGTLMGPAMLWMLHGVLTGEGDALSEAALVVFLGLHVVPVAVVIAGAVFAARLSPRLGSWVARWHLPFASHLWIMAVSAGVSAFAVHLAIHGAS